MEPRADQDRWASRGSVLRVIAACLAIAISPSNLIYLANLHPAMHHRSPAAVDNGGTVWAWGLGNFGQLGNGTCDPNVQGGVECASSAVPVKVKGLGDIVAVAAGEW